MATAPQLRFLGGGTFNADLQRGVEAYFEAAGRARHGGFPLVVKIVAMLFWLAASWAVAVFVRVPASCEVLLTISTALAMAGVGFSVMHDANHGACLASPR